MNLIAKDKWTGRDKILHFFLCLIITIIWGYQTAAIAGVFKEMRDVLYGNGFSYKDIFWNSLGCIAGEVIRKFILGG